MTKKTTILFMFILIVAFVGCKKSADVPVVPVTPAAGLQVSSFEVTAERADPASAQAIIEGASSTLGDTSLGYLYTINLGVAESMGGTATVTSVVFNFLNNGTSFGSYSPDVTSVFSNATISAGNNVMGTEKRVSAGNDDPYADEIIVEVTYTDGKGATKVATSSYTGPQYKDADIVVVPGTVSTERLLGILFANVDVINQGTRDATSYTVILTFFDSTDSMVNGLIKEMNQPLAVNAGKSLTGICITTYTDLAYYEWRTTWTKSNGEVMSKSGRESL